MGMDNFFKDIARQFLAAGIDRIAKDMSLNGLEADNAAADLANFIVNSAINGDGGEILPPHPMENEKRALSIFKKLGS